VPSTRGGEEGGGVVEGEVEEEEGGVQHQLGQGMEELQEGRPVGQSTSRSARRCRSSSATPCRSNSAAQCRANSATL